MIKKITCLLMALTLCFSLEISSYAYEADSIFESETTYGENGGPIDTVIRPTKGISKEVYAATINQMDIVTANTNAEEIYYLSAVNTDDPKKEVNFSTTLTFLNGSSSSDMRASGGANMFWFGSDPYYCDEISMSNAFIITGVTVGFSFAGGADWTVTPGLTNASAVWNKTYEDEYSISHKYTNVDFDGIEIYVKQRVTGGYTFGTTTYEVTAVDSTLL